MVMYNIKYYDGSGFMFANKLYDNLQKAQKEFKLMTSKIEKLGGCLSMERYVSPDLTIEKKGA
jgi:hypothetical protein